MVSFVYDEVENSQNGRQLAGISKDGLTASYAYNDSGIRLRKTVNGVTTQYYLNGSMIVAEVTGDVQTDYYYDESGNVFGFKRGDSEYYYIRNGQGDIIGILDSSGTQIVSYVYDSWGKLVSVTDASGNDKSGDASFIGNLNPFRYRGYYYDTETGLYYLQSRYYDPEVGRFLNADGLLGANENMMAYNLFAYCSNNPVNMSDPSGKVPFVVGLIIGVVASWVADGLLEATTGYGGGHWVAEGLKSLQSALQDSMNWAFEKEHEKELGPDVPQHIPGPDEDKSFYIWKEKEDEYYQVRYGYQPDVAGYEPTISDLIEYNIIPYRSNYRLSEDGTKIVWDSATGD